MLEIVAKSMFTKKKASSSIPYPIKTGVIIGNEKMDVSLSPMNVTKGS
jgi:hypothetical protein